VKPGNKSGIVINVDERVSEAQEKYRAEFQIRLNEFEKEVKKRTWFINSV